MIQHRDHSLELIAIISDRTGQRYAPLVSEYYRLIILDDYKPAMAMLAIWNKYMSPPETTA